MSFQQIGLQGVFLTQAFNAGMKDYLSGLKQAGSATSTATQSMTLLGDKGAGAVAKGLGIAGLATAGLAAGAAILTATLSGAVTVMGMLANKAAPLEGIEASFNAMAVSAGVSLKELSKAAAGTISDFDLMRQANVALTGAGGQFRKEFAEALPTLLEGARIAAQGTGQSVEFLFQSLVTGVKRTSPLLIDNTGIVLKVGESNEKMAESVGKSTDALSTEEKQIALLHATMEGIANIQAVVGTAAETLTVKQERSKATFENIASTLGTYFVPAFKTVADAVNNLSSAFLVAIQEGGGLYGFLVDLGAVLSIAADGFSYLLGKATSAVEGMTDDIESDISTLISDMFTWGANMAISLAEGLIEGATTAIAAAANAVANMISYWFQGNSPPRVAPDIDAWGAATMNEYLKGFSEADFGMLKDVQKSLKSVFDVFVDQGKFTKESASRLWASISQDMIKGLETGDMSKAYAKIKNAAGEYSGVILKLLTDQQKLAEATNQVKNAELALEASRKKSIALQSKRSSLVAQYNDLLRKGAGKDVLAAKLAEINATEDAQAAAEAEIVTNEANVASAKDRASALEDQVNLTKELISQMTDIAKAAAAREAIKEAPKAGGAGGGGIGSEEEGTGEGTTLGDAIGNGIASAIEAAKERIKLALSNALAEAVRSAKEKLAGPLAELQLAWDTLTTNLGLAWDNLGLVAGEKWQLIQDKITGITEPINQWFADWGTFFTGWWTEHGANLGIIIDDYMADNQKKWENMTAVIGPIVEAFWSNISASFTLWTGILIEWLTGAWTTISENATMWWDTIKNMIGLAWEAIQTSVQGALEVLGDIIDVAAAAITGDWDLFWEEIADLLDTWWEAINTSINDWLEVITTGLSGFYDIGANTIQGLWDGMSAIWTQLESWLKGKIESMPQWVKDILGIASPSRIFYGIGANIMRGFADGMEALSPLPIKTMAQTTLSTMRPAMAASPVSTSIYRTNNLNMGGVNINSGMDMAALEAAMNRIISR